MLDVSRHFLSLMTEALYGPDVELQAKPAAPAPFDDQGWQMEIKSWPKLTNDGGRTQVKGGGRGGFYTQAEYADLCGMRASAS